jgi:hypothetical protein
MNKIKIKKNRGFVPYGAKSSRSGFVILFAIMLSSIVLAIALGVSNIALKEINFSTSAKDTNDAFFAADTGAECALYYDNSLNNAFSPTSTISSIACVNYSNPIILSHPGGISQVWDFTLTGLGSSGQGCAKVTVDKTDTTTPLTKITSKGYNKGSPDCVSTTNTVERELEVTY